MKRIAILTGSILSFVASTPVSRGNPAGFGQ